MSATETRINDLDAFQEALSRRPSLRGLTMTGLDFTQLTLDWTRIDLEAAVFLGCVFSEADFPALRGRGASILDRFVGLPYDPFRTRLYTPRELMFGKEE